MDGLSNYIDTAADEMKFWTTAYPSGVTLGNLDFRLGGAITGNFTMADDAWVGLGSSAGRIVFDNQATDYVKISDAYLGVGVNPISALTLPASTGEANGITLGTIDTGAIFYDDNTGLYVSSGGNIKLRLDDNDNSANTLVILNGAGDTVTSIAETGVITNNTADGTAPFVVSSTTVNSNLNADLLDGNHASAFQPANANLDDWAGLTGALGNIPYGSGAGTLAMLPGNATTTPKVLGQVGDGVNSAAPTWVSFDPIVPDDSELNITGSVAISSALDVMQDIAIHHTAPQILLSDTTASAKSAIIDVDANIFSIYEPSNPWYSLLTCNLANNRVGIRTETPSEAFEITAGHLRFNTIAAPGACTATQVSGGGALSASTAYTYRITYVTASGETEAGTASSPGVTVSANDSIQLSNIPVSSSPFVTARKIYRNKSGSLSDWYLCNTIADNTTTTYLDTKADANLGANRYTYTSNSTAGVLKVGTAQAIRTQSNETAVGLGALPVSQGFSNVAVGTNALASVTSGYYHVGIGYNALYSASSGSSCIGIGYEAARSMAGNHGTVAVGFQSLYSTTGGYNTAIGGLSGSTSTSGTYNVFVGRESGNGTATAENITTDDYCGFLGYQSGQVSGSGDLQNAWAIGKQALVGADNTLAIGGNGAGGGTAIKVDVSGDLQVRGNDIQNSDGEATITMNADQHVALAGELSIKVYSQASEPTLSADNYMAIWIDTDDSNKVYLVFRRGTGDQVKVQLT